MSRNKRARLIGPSLATFVMLVALVGLGVWQIHRLHWKETLLDAIARGENGSPVALTDHPPAFARVWVEGKLGDDWALYGVQVRDTLHGQKMGAQLIVPLLRDGLPPVLVDRGWVPTDAVGDVRQPTGTVAVEGYVRQSEQPGPFSVKDDPGHRLFYTMNPEAIGHALGLPQVAPFMLVALGTPHDDVYPAPAEHLPQPPNNHLQYALTWFSLAVILAVIYGSWLRKAIRS